MTESSPGAQPTQAVERPPLSTLRHSLAHLMASAVQKLHPGVRFGFGPSIEHGFYYDFELPGGATFSNEDLEAIEARMRQVIDADFELND